MSWMEDIQKSLNYIEDNLTENINAEMIANHIYSSNHHFQKVFNIVTGLTVSDYIRYRRLSLAGQELIESRIKVIDVALKYGYETPESFSKAFQKFHGVLPSQIRTSENSLKNFIPLSIQIIINGGFVMARKLIPNVLKLYEIKSENYTFPSCMHSAMAALNEDEAFDFTFFAGVTGDLFAQVWNTHKWSYNDAYSSVYRDGVEKPIKAAFDACGYEYELISEDKIKADKAEYIKKIVASIDKGFPVITFGIVGPPICSIICGYDDNGNILIGRSQFIDVPQENNTIDLQVCEDYFQTKNGLDNSELLIFITKKKNAFSISKSMHNDTLVSQNMTNETIVSLAMRESIHNLPVLAFLPPVQGKRPSVYGMQAFNAWADSLLVDDDFKDESMLNNPLDTYSSCTVMLGTNMYYIQEYLNRVIKLCPDMKQQIEKLKQYFSKECEALDELLAFQGGYSFEKKDKLFDRNSRVELAEKIREIGKRYMEAATWVNNICERK